MSVTVKLFMQDDCQALDLPDEFRFEGEEVRISRVGDKVILEPLKMPPDGIPDDPPPEPDPRVFFDE